MNLVAQMKKKLSGFKVTASSWLLKAEVEPAIVYASNNKLLLGLLYAVTVRKKLVGGCFTTAQEVLAHLKENKTGMLMSSINLEDGSGDALIQQARLLQPELRCLLVADHNKYSAAEAASWRSNVIVAAADIGDESEPLRMAILSAIANTSFRSKSIAQKDSEASAGTTIVLNQREKEMLQCFALGLTNTEAAERLHLSPHSTKTYSRNLLAKLEVSNRQLALVKALGKGLFKAF
jgi:DNA-binding NarL/FixJ family response regulator